MKYLLDTHIFLWSLNNDKRLKSSIKKILVDPGQAIYISVISAWEISIKSKTHPNFKLRTSIKEVFDASGFEILPVFFKHTLEVDKLSFYHKDPFDRILIAQALAENLTLITSDQKIWKYKLKLMKA